ncbi:NAD(P)-dependent alcohol dehydrogenase [Actinomadura sp. NPDC049382]|uniref:NAD(P)-dependent alcohol dehydrogenase n=1 Tax=Actinomadura sp. NPDC049382 TaxID=3158220 RepID=UPI0034151182
MQAAQLLEPGRFEIREIATPVVGEGQVLLKVVGAGMCGSDVHLVRHPPKALPLPLTLGHETTGRVVELGSGVTGLSAGDAVLVAGIWSCGTCPACAEGRDNACSFWATRTAVPPGPGLGHPGGMAEYMVAPARSLVPLGDLDPVTAAPLADAGIAPSHAISLARRQLRPDATAVVIGVGGLGHLAVQILRATTACRIVAVDIDDDRLAAALDHGADVTLRSEQAAEALLDLTGGLGANAVFDFVGTDGTLEIARRTVATYGAIIIVGLGGGTLQVHAAPAPIKRQSGLPWGVSVQRPYGATRRDITEVIALAAAGRITAHIQAFPLHAAPEVLQRLEQGHVHGRAVLLPNGPTS